MQYELLKYRNLQPNDNMWTSDLLYFNNALHKDAKEKKLDPYAYKISVSPPTA